MPATPVVTVSRTLLTLADLTISASPFRLGGDSQTFTQGSKTWRREEAKSPYMHGSALIGAVKDTVQAATIDVDVVGVDQATVRTNVTTLLAAFEQFTYTLTLSLDGTTWAWTCQPADSTVDPMHPSNVYGFLCPVRLVYQRHPIPTAGPW